MRRLILSLTLKISTSFLLVILLLFCGGDSCPKHHETVFEGWERPVLPATTEPTAETVSDVCTQEILTENDTEWKSEAETEAFTSKAESFEPSETQNADNLTLPTVMIGEAEILSDGKGYGITVTVSKLPKNSAFALLLILCTQGNDPIYSVCEQSIPDGTYFSSFIYSDGLGVLIDGKILNETGKKEVIFEILIKRSQDEPPKIFVKYHEYAENALKISVSDP
ncbi:MAG: hypothetical protein IJW00_01270 [Clostridia bacterium]|nr:hypothetical protein [Clostridia bacterium]